MMGGGAQQITGPQADMTKSQDGDFDSVLLDYKAKGTTIDLVGTEPIDGKPAYHLKIVTEERSGPALLPGCRIRARGQHRVRLSNRREKTK